MLATRQVGRLGVIAEHYPLIFPVNYALDHDVIVIRTGKGTKSAYALHANITFEVDHIDEVTHAGWSVLVKGLAEEVTPAHGEEVARPYEGGRAEALGSRRARALDTHHSALSSRGGS